MQKIRVLPHVATTFFDDSAVLLDLRKNAYYALNNSAADFWKLLVENNSFEETITKLTESYRCSDKILKQDMEELIYSLLQIGLIEKG